MGVGGAAMHQQNRMMCRVAAPIQIMQPEPIDLGKSIDRRRWRGRRRRIVVHQIPFISKGLTSGIGSSA
jgi:hypothetical protein